MLVVLGRTPDRGRRLSDLAAAVGVSAASMSDSVAALERKGLISKEPAAEDRRAKAIRATPEGLREAAALAEWPEPILSVPAGLPPGDRGDLLRALSTVIVGLQDRNLVSSSRLCVTCRYFRPNQHADADRPHHCAFVDAAFGDRSLRLDCDDHEPRVTTGEAD